MDRHLILFNLFVNFLAFLYFNPFFSEHYILLIILFVPEDLNHGFYVI